MLDYKKLKALTPHFGKTNGNLFTYKEFEHLLNLRPFVNEQRFIPALDKHRYLWPTPSWHSQLNCWPVSAIKQVLKYSAIYLRDCSRANRKINGFSEKLEAIFKRPVDCHIYFSNNSNISLSFGKHKDVSHNVIVVQSGKINFKIFNENEYDDKVRQVKILSKGDYAFVPAGVYHSVDSLTKKRLSCSFPITLNGNSFDEREWLSI
tara:strand:+ start:64 stop:681 length:618 start_codon:yes stop_codon:yes gene_type:complete